MVKKISGTEGPGKAKEVSRVSETEAVKGISEISRISEISSIRGLSGTSSISGLGPRLSPQNQEEVLRTIDSEAEKLFAGKRIPRKRQKTITDALKMAVVAATLKDETE